MLFTLKANRPAQHAEVATRFADLQSRPEPPATVAPTGSAAFYLFSARMNAERFAAAVRAHWRIENSLHRVLDVVASTKTVTQSPR